MTSSTDAAQEPPTQEQISREIEAAQAAYRASRQAGGEEQLQPDADFPPYRSSLLRHPT